MRIYAIDDETLNLETLCRMLQAAAPGAELRGFDRVTELLEAVAAEEKPDVIFSDIEMPGMGGLELAVRLKALAPEARIVFVTGYSEYAVEAYRLHIGGYVMKPVTVERLREELALVPALSEREAPRDKLQVRCFGAFEVFWQGKPLSFRRTKTKELLAYLVDRRGEMCTCGEIIAALWEGEGDRQKRKGYLRTLTIDLRDVLAGIGMGKALLREHQQWAVLPEYLDCDYYRMLEGDVEALNRYRGEYMSRYSWAELTSAQLQFRQK